MAESFAYGFSRTKNTAITKYQLPLTCLHTHKYYLPVEDSLELLLLCQEKRILLLGVLQDLFYDLLRKKGIKR